MKQLELGVTMPVVRTAIVGLMIGVGMDDRYPIHDMNVGKSDKTSQIGHEQRGK